MLRNGSEGSPGKCPEEPEGKTQLVCWRAPAQVPRGALFAEQVWYDSRSVLGKINRNITCTLLPTKCYVTVLPIFWIFARFTDVLELHTHPSLLLHLKGIVARGAAEACGIVCTFQSRKSIRNFHDTMTAIFWSHLNYRITSCFERKLERMLFWRWIGLVQLVKETALGVGCSKPLPGSFPWLQSSLGPSSDSWEDAFAYPAGSWIENTNDPRDCPRP